VSGSRFLLSIFITQGIQTMNARLITVEQRSHMVAAWSPTVDDAAKSLGVSGSTIRRKAAKLGVRKLSGKSVAGFVLFESHQIGRAHV
jgi:hypothetical protein